MQTPLATPDDLLHAMRSTAHGGGQLSVLVFELDRLQGSPIVQVGEQVRAVVRSRDVLAHLAGSRMGLLLSSCSVSGCSLVAERIRALVATGGAATASVGFAHGAGAAEAVLARAEACLHAAIRGGRDRVVGTGWTR